MSWPTDPKKAQVLERIITVLKSIATGSTYFYTPASVEKRYTHFKEVTEGPAYSVHLDTGGRLTDGLGEWKTEEFYVNVKGTVLDEQDAATAIARSLRDIRYAINQDMKSSATGSLASICSHLFIEDGAETDNGYLSLEGKGYFEQRIRIIVSGTIDQL
jgi:hypothetical protein